MAAEADQLSTLRIKVFSSPISCSAMNNPFNSIFQAFNQRLSAIETTITRKENVLSFLIIRFVLMTGMVLGFTWAYLHLNP
jgi:hypothetical protein